MSLGITHAKATLFDQLMILDILLKGKNFAFGKLV